MAVNLYKEILTPEWLKTNFMLGVSLLDENGRPFPESLYTESIKRAVKFTEDELRIAIERRIIENERHELDVRQKLRWWPVVLDVVPLIKLNGASVQYGSFQPTTVPSNWFLITSHLGGRISITPAPGTQPLSFGSNISALFMSPGWAGGVEYLPGYFGFEYEAGLPLFDGTVDILAGDATSHRVTLPYTIEDPGYEVMLVVKTAAQEDDYLIPWSSVDHGQSYFTFEPERAPKGNVTVRWILNGVEADLRGYIGKRAAMMTLIFAGNLLGGQGIASSSQSQDGISQVIATTSSPENHGYSAHVRQFERELKFEREALIGKWSQIRSFGI